ncbi:MAG: hypothetical protein ACI8QZ_001847 [Chlamydiales bacterium]|jgi:uncharacterized protein YceH (UPF0502 family)
MADQLNPHEARVIGVLIEKAFTTPDQYPLSLHAATTGSNQKSNRNPVMFFTEAEVDVTLQGLRMKHIAGSVTPAGSRVEKWTHSARQHFGLDDQGLAVLAELLLRGPQTQGELRTRANRMSTIDSLEVLASVTSRLIEQGYVQKLAPLSGSRAGRLGQTLAARLALEDGPEPGEAAARAHESSAPSTPASAAPAPPGLGRRVETLEQEVGLLRRALTDLAEKLGESIDG